MSEIEKRLADLPMEKRKLLAERLYAKRRSGQTVGTIPHRGNADALPLSFAQERLWFLNQLEPHNEAYTIAQILYLAGTLDTKALEASLSDIVRRHEILRTSLPVINGEAKQRVSSPGPVNLSFVDLSGLESEEREAAAKRSILEAARQPFDLTHGPLVRFTLVRFSEDDHRLLVTWHHIVADGWSFRLFERELGEFYTARMTGRTASLPDLPIQYADYALWQRQRLQGEKRETQLTYWKEQLAGAPNLLSLPTDRPRPAVQTYRGAAHKMVLQFGLVDGLKDLSRQENATLFMVLLAAFQTLLYRLSGEKDITVGSPIAGRNMVETERLIGIFINTLVLRTKFDDGSTFREVLKQVRQMTLDAYEHQDLPFEKLVEELQPARHMSHSPMFQVMVVFQNQPNAPANFHDLKVRREFADLGSSMFDVSLYVQPAQNELELTFEYNTDLFDGSTIARWAGHFERLIEEIVTDPDTRIRSLPLLAEAERDQLVVDWNATAAAYPRETCVHDLISAQADRTPDAVAVEYEGQRLSYGDLDRRSNQLANHLRTLGMAREVRVGLCVERSLDMVVGLLGILKAGGAYVPLDPGFPRDRLAFMVQDAEVPLLLTEAGLVDSLPAHEARVVCLDRDWAEISKESEESPSVLVDGEQLAYVIYTSGSTGTPKGVQIPHRALTNFLTSMAREPGLSAEDRLLAVTTLSFDIAGLELYLPLTQGASVVIVSREVASDASRLAERLDAHDITAMQATSTTWRMLLEAGWSGGAGLKALCGGETLPRDLAEKLLAQGVELWNMYGPTETTIWSTVDRVVSDERLVSIGHPIANTQVYVLDPAHELVPIGVSGELYIGGAGVARGYWKRLELTAERFVPDPFSEDPGARLYRTGDRARWRNDGALEHLGRLDDQVKVRGFRVELGEIETVLAEHPEVRQAAVHLWTVNPGDVRIVACCVPARAGALAPISLRKHLRARLPEHMIPQHFLPVKEIPLTPNGKVDRRRLPTPIAAERSTGQHEAPADAVEAAIAEIWTQLIQPARAIGRNDNFFEIGGHSLLALRALRQMEHKLGVKLELHVLILDHLADIAIRCQSKRTVQGAA